MAGRQVVLYFEKDEDAVQFTLAASSALSADEPAHMTEAGLRMAAQICKASRIATESSLALATPIAPLAEGQCA